MTNGTNGDRNEPVLWFILLMVLLLANMFNCTANGSFHLSTGSFSTLSEDPEKYTR